MIQFDEFLNLNQNQVLNLIKSDRLSVQSEEKVFECVIGWIQFDPQNRQQHLAMLMVS